MTDVYRNAFTEVYEIINYLNECDYNKIPNDVISVIEENRNKEYEYFLDESISLKEQKMLPETKAILFNFFKEYFATKEQREKIQNFQRRERINIEEKKKQEYKCIDEVFSIKKQNKNADKNIEEKNLTVLEKTTSF